MPSRPGFLQPKQKINEAEWAESQAQTLKRLRDFFAPEGAPVDEPAPEAAPGIDAAPDAAPGTDVAAEIDAAPAIDPAPGLVDSLALPELPWPIIVQTGGQNLPSVPAPDRIEAASDQKAGGDDDTVVSAEAGVVAISGGAPVLDIQRPALVGVFDRPPITKKPAKDRAAKKKPAKPAPTIAAHCPSCGAVLNPVPTSNKRCERCRQRIIVKQLDGAAVYLTEAAVQVFDGERKRVANMARWTRERDHWLRLAAGVGAPDARRAHLAASRLTEDVVAESRALYVNAADRAFSAARQGQDWDAAARVRRDTAVALHVAAGSPLPPPADLVALYREGIAAELRGVSEIARDAELVSSDCCTACRADGGKVARISRELREPRLPHANCPRGLCRCRWDLTARDRVTMEKYVRRSGAR